MIYLVDLEYVETRYTAQWKDCFPQQIADVTGQDITVIEGPDDIANGTTPGAFLDFAGTNIYKSEQIKIITEHLNLVKYVCLIGNEKEVRPLYLPIENTGGTAKMIVKDGDIMQQLALPYGILHIEPIEVKDDSIFINPPDELRTSI